MPTFACPGVAARRYRASPTTAATTLGPPLDTAIRARELGHRPGVVREAAARDFRDWCDTRRPADLIIFTDGSKLPNGNAGSGWVGYQNGVEVFRGRGSFGASAEVFDAQARVALGGLLMAMQIQPVGNTFICLDYLQVACQLGERPSRLVAIQFVFDQVASVLDRWPWPRPPSFRRCPGHSSIPGNELADDLAKAAAAAQPPGRSLFSTAAAARIIKNRRWPAAQAAWLSERPGSYSRFPGLHADTIPRELSLPRFALGKLLAARSQHGDFSRYHQRFDHEDAILTCTCGEEKTPTHFWSCQSVNRRYRRPWGPRHKAGPFAPGSAAGDVKFAQWVSQTQFFTEICPVRPRQRPLTAPPE